MTDSEFDELLNEARERLREKQAVLSDRYRLGQSERFVVDYAEGTLTTFDGEMPVAEAKIIPVATHVPDEESLLWAWSNEHFPPDMREKSAAIMGLYEVTGFDLFKEDPADCDVQCDEVMAWDITALACKHLDAIGAYRIPHENVFSYVLIAEIRAFG